MIPIILCAGISAATSLAPMPAQEPPLVGALAALRLVRPGVQDTGRYWGTVTKVDAGFLTIRGTGEWRIPPNEIPGVVTFTASDVLRGGGFPTDRPPAVAYRLTDVKVGDGVRVEFIVLKGLEVVTHIGITRRPGGRVPPSPAERPDAENKYHEWANAYNDWKEKGIPLPDKYDPEYQKAETAARVAEYLGGLLSRPNRLSEKERRDYAILRDAYRKEAADFTARTGRNIDLAPPKPRVKPIPVAKD